MIPKKGVSPHRKICEELEHNFMVMILKKEMVEDFKDYKPASLIGSLYKLLPKVLANRLKKVLPLLINKAQMFCGWSKILDASLISNEMINSMYKRKERGVLCKFDIKKAYDHVN